MVYVVNMMTGMGLALGIDYSLLVISLPGRTRPRTRQRGRHPHDRGDGQSGRPPQRHHLRHRSPRTVPGPPTSCAAWPPEQ